MSEPSSQPPRGSTPADERTWRSPFEDLVDTVVDKAHDLFGRDDVQAEQERIAAAHAEREADEARLAAERAERAAEDARLDARRAQEEFEADARLAAEEAERQAEEARREAEEARHRADDY